MNLNGEEMQPDLFMLVYLAMDILMNRNKLNEQVDCPGDNK